MLKLNKEEVHFLVTAEMKKEVADFLEAVDAKIAPVLEYIKENQVERVCFIGCGSSSAAGSTAKYLADKYTTLTVNAYTDGNSLIPCLYMETEKHWQFLFPSPELQKKL